MTGLRNARAKLGMFSQTTKFPDGYFRSFEKFSKSKKSSTDNQSIAPNTKQQSYPKRKTSQSDKWTYCSKRENRC